MIIRNDIYLFLDHSILCIRILDMIPIESRPVKHSFEITQWHLTYWLPYARHKRGCRPWHKIDDFCCWRILLFLVWGIFGGWWVGGLVYSRWFCGWSRGCYVWGFFNNNVDALVQGVQYMVARIRFPAKR